MYTIINNIIYLILSMQYSKATDFISTCMYSSATTTPLHYNILYMYSCLQ